VYCPPTEVCPTYLAACKALNSHFHLDGSSRAVIDGHLQDGGVQVIVPGLRSISAGTHSHIKRLLSSNGIGEWDWWVDSTGLRLHLCKLGRAWPTELLMLTIPLLFIWYFDVHQIYA